MRSLDLKLAVAVCACVSLAGCSTSEAGNARPVDTPTATSDGASSRPSSTRTTTSSAPSPLDRVEPCQLLSDSDRAQLKLEPGKPKNFGRSKGCDWDSDKWGLAVGFKTDLAFKDADLRGAQPIRVDIGRHEAHEVENAGGGDGACEVFIVTGEKSFVQVTGVTLNASDTPFACDRVIAVAKVIDPKLP